MANRTVRYAQTVHGTNPQYLIEKIIRERIYDSKYWQEECFMITSAQVLEHAIDDLKYVGGTYGAKIDPSPFLCLVLKLLQIQPKREIIYLYIEQQEFKYLRALGSFYLRLVGTAKEIYTRLEPIYIDYRKLRLMSPQRTFSLLHMDEFIDSLLHDDKVLNISLPRLTKRIVLEENRDIAPYKSELEEQNLIPSALIEEEIELQRDEERKFRLGHASPSYRSQTNHHQAHSSSRRNRDERGHDRYDDRHRGSRYRDSRYRSTSPQLHKSMATTQTSGGRYRFSQAEIDSENAIRAKAGLKPLK